jgi:hypothetical protein
MVARVRSMPAATWNSPGVRKLPVALLGVVRDHENRFTVVDNLAHGDRDGIRIIDESTNRQVPIGGALSVTIQLTCRGGAIRLTLEKP